MNVTVDVQGLEDAVKQLRRVEQRVSIKTIRAAQRFAMKPAIDKAKSIVPYNGKADDDGFHLRNTIGVRSEKKRARAGNASIMRFGVQRVTSDGADPNGYAIRGGLGKGPKSPIYDHLIHKENPFLITALEQTQTQVVARFGSKIVSAVKKL